MPSRFQPLPGFERATFGLVGWLEATKITLPLHAVDCRFEVRGELAGVEVDQVFHQSSAEPLDCRYTFPLPAGAAVYRCEMHVNGRVISARVEEEVRAREIAIEQKAAGRRTALVEMERDNLFTLSLGNLQPGDQVIVRFAYFQTLSRLQDRTSLQIPLCPGIRYIPGKPLLRSPSGAGVIDDTDQVPDASRISPPRIDGSSPGVATLHVEGIIDDPGAGIHSVTSPSHPLVVSHPGKSFGIQLSNTGSLPDQDFVLRWSERPAKEVEAAAWSWTEGSETYAMVRIAPTSEPAAPLGQAAARTPSDIYFLLDRSGSMAGLKWQKTAQAFLEFLRPMKPDDRVWLTVFSSGFEDFAEKPLPARAILEDKAVARLVERGADGGTELLPAIVHVTAQMPRFSIGRRKVMILITDGQIGNEAEVIRRMAELPDLTVHVVGIDTAPNDALLKALAERHNGDWHQVHPNDDIVGTVSRLGGMLQSPILELLRIPPDWEPADEIPGQIYANRSVTLLLRSVEAAPSSSIELTARRAEGSACKLTAAIEAGGSPAVKRLWQRGRIQSLLRQGRSPEAIELAKAANQICTGAAFIAWDESEKVAVSGREVYQPSVDSFMLGCAPGVLRLSLRNKLNEYPSSPPLHGMDLSLANIGEPRVDDLRARRLMETQPRRDQILDFWLRHRPGNLDPLKIGWLEALFLSLSGFEEDLAVMVLRLMELPGASDTPKLGASWREVVKRLAGWLSVQERTRREELFRELDQIMRTSGVDPGQGRLVIASLIDWVGRSIPGTHPGRQELVSAMGTFWSLVLASPAPAAADPRSPRVGV